MASGSSVLITVPKYVTIKRVQTTIPNNRVDHGTINWSLQHKDSVVNILQDKTMETSKAAVLSYDDNGLDETENILTQPRKKRRLDHLTWEEKIQRK